MNSQTVTVFRGNYFFNQEAALLELFYSGMFSSLSQLRSSRPRDCKLQFTDPLQTNNSWLNFPILSILVWRDFVPSALILARLHWEFRRCREEQSTQSYFLLWFLDYYKISRFNTKYFLFFSLIIRNNMFKLLFFSTMEIHSHPISL